MAFPPPPFTNIEFGLEWRQWLSRELFTWISAFEALPATVNSSTYTADANTLIILADDDTVGGVITITLPPARDFRHELHIKKIGNTANIIVDGNGSETIDGGLTATLTIQYESIMLTSNGINWFVI